MGSKNNPGAYDCYANAEPDEPMFVLLARDETSQYFVAAWVAVRCGDLQTAEEMMERALRARDGNFKEPDNPKMIEAMGCAVAMNTWAQNKFMDAIEKRRNRD